jgi:hypothetical protein
MSVLTPPFVWNVRISGRDEARPAVLIVRYALLQTDELLAQFAGQFAGLSVSDWKFAAGMSNQADAGEDRGRAASEGFDEPATGSVVLPFRERVGALLDAQAPFFGKHDH